MWFKQILTWAILLILVWVVIKFTGSDRYDLLYTDQESISKYKDIVSGYNNIKISDIDNSQILDIQKKISWLAGTTNSQSVKDKLLSLMDKSDSLKKIHQVSSCLDMISKLDKLSVNNISTTWLDSNTNPACSTQIKLMKNKIKSINKQYQQYEVYKNIYMSWLDSCDEIQNIYESIIAFNKQAENFWPNDCNISVSKLNLQNIWSNLKNIYTWDTIDSLVNKIKILKWNSLTGTEIQDTISNKFKNRRWKIN